MVMVLTNSFSSLNNQSKPILLYLHSPFLLYCSDSSSGAIDPPQPKPPPIEIIPNLNPISNSTSESRKKDRKKTVKLAWEKLVRWSRSWRSKNNTDVLQRTKKVVVLGGGSFGTTMDAHVANNKAEMEVTMLLRDPVVCLSINESHYNCTEGDIYGQAASNLVAGNNFEAAIQQILDMRGGNWDRDTIIRALRASFNNPERVVDYLYSGIPEQALVPPVAQPTTAAPAVNDPSQAPQPTLLVLSAGPNANPLDLFPQSLGSLDCNYLYSCVTVRTSILVLFFVGAGSLDFLRNNPQFQALRAMVQQNPKILQELGKQNPHLMRLIQEHQADFLRLINEPTIVVTPEERDAIERVMFFVWREWDFLEQVVLEVFFACNKNEELAANYLLDHNYLIIHNYFSP
ncbi:hypothetical protein MKX03_031995 [Papaver bracteatum]|nr:hypothetical protein MKX03_031995 [Papaver bracteatum]